MIIGSVDSFCHDKTKVYFGCKGTKKERIRKEFALFSFGVTGVGE